MRHYKIHTKGIFSWIPLISSIHRKNDTSFTVSVTIGESKRFYEGTLVKSNDLQFVAKFAIAGPDGEIPEETQEDVTVPGAQEDFTEAREIEAMRRRVGTVQDGVSVELSWESDSDLGLSVVDGDGAEVSFFAPEGLEGASFDMAGFEPKAGQRKISLSENAPTGSYTVLIKHFESEGEAEETEFSVKVNNRGDEQEMSGTIPSDGSQVEAGTFEI